MAEVAREAADVVLTDDDFATIVAAIREGRAIADNIRKFVAFLLSANLARWLSSPLRFRPDSACL